MMIVRIEKGRVVSVLNQVKQMVRLGEGAFESRRLQPEPMRRTVAALRVFAGMCRAYSVDEVVALATAAVRDAVNGPVFLEEIRRETGFDFTVISGREEARLISRGVSVALEPFAGKRMFIDIGGGSTELSVATGTGILDLESLKLGAVRLAGIFPVTEVVGEKLYAEMQKYIRAQAVLPLQRMECLSPEELVGSSGTIQNLAEMAAAMSREAGRKTGDTPELLSYGGLRRVVKALCERSEEARMGLPGINPRRTGILIPGAAILQTVMEALDFDSVRVSGRGLRDGALVDYLERMFPESGQLSVREESVLRLARRCRFEERHSRHVEKLALMLFDRAGEQGLYKGSSRIRELLGYAALLHDIGIFVSFSRHNVHSHYLIRNSELLGFTEREVAMMAALDYFHRYGLSRKDKVYAALGEETGEEIRCPALFLSLGEALDKSHRQAVTSAELVRKNGVLTLDIRTSGPCPVEQERLKRCIKAIEKSFGRIRITWNGI